MGKIFISELFGCLIFIWHWTFSFFSFSEPFVHILREEVLILGGSQILSSWTRIPDLCLLNQSLLLLRLQIMRSRKTPFPVSSKADCFFWAQVKMIPLFPGFVQTSNLSHKEILKVFIWKWFFFLREINAQFWWYSLLLIFGFGSDVYDLVLKRNDSYDFLSIVFLGRGILK